MQSEKKCENCIHFEVCCYVSHQLPVCDFYAETPVLCKYCEYQKDAKVNSKGFLICPASGMEITDRDFCSYGSRLEL